MNPDEREILSRLLIEYGTAGVAAELASICRERAKDPEQIAAYCSTVLESAAKQFDLIAR